ncbi:MAG: homoserine O-acetyltransferase MetA [Acidobacteriota bacterium]
MPIKVRDGLPAISQLQKENIFVMSESNASHQDIRPLRILLLNLMPEKAKTELHLLRRLSNSPIQVELDLIHPATHQAKTTDKEYLDTFYKTFEETKQNKYDGLIITGAPVEHLRFEEVDYWNELTEIMEWSKHHVTSTLHICWAAQAGLYYHYGVDKHPIEEKKFGVFSHTILNRNCPLVRGFDDVFLAPHSRHTTVRPEEVEGIGELEIISVSPEAGLYIVVSRNGKQVFVTGHSEYDVLTLKEEYERDRAKGLAIQVPKNYFPDDDPSKTPLTLWSSHSNLLFTNWINYYIYQQTPFRIEEIH